mmetsp:Transcript_16482/g.34828  ORF Transcript_16482/g.34828 Transcript_16482/m.34828 type:complete len:208 (+) Transcript_16482:574-1197(+)
MDDEPSVGPRSPEVDHVAKKDPDTHRRNHPTENENGRHDLHCELGGFEKRDGSVTEEHDIYRVDQNRQSNNGDAPAPYAHGPVYTSHDHAGNGDQEQSGVVRQRGASPIRSRSESLRHRDVLALVSHVLDDINKLVDLGNTEGHSGVDDDCVRIGNRGLFRLAPHTREKEGANNGYAWEENNHDRPLLALLQGLQAYSHKRLRAPPL